ncbi:MAG TPA: DUF364 domain-containing protein [Burkholderiaceae bacterium]
MSIAAELVAALEARFERDAAPAVRALHLPPPGAVGKAGEFCALELADGALGLTFVLLDGLLERLPGLRLGPLEGADALSVARWAREAADDARRTLGFAAINALTRTLFDRAGYVPPAARDSFGGLAPGQGDHVGMIGLFPSLVGPLLATGARLTVVELRPDVAGDREGYRITLDAGELAHCNKVLSTSSVLLNGTLDRMLELCRHASRFDLIGPGAGCLPGPLFRRGVTAIGGTWIEDREGLKTALLRGSNWGGCVRKFVIERGDSPWN